MYFPNTAILEPSPSTRRRATSTQLVAYLPSRSIAFYALCSFAESVPSCAPRTSFENMQEYREQCHYIL